MLVVNLFGGPGTGKSTYATRLFSDLKVAGVNAEYVSEYAKDIVWGKEFAKLDDQLYILAKQNRKLHRLQGQVDVAVSDSPLLLGLHYAPPYYLGSTYTALTKELFATYQNLNIFLTRDPAKKYNASGRMQTEEEAKKIDESLRRILANEDLSFQELSANLASIPEALALVMSSLEALKKAA